MVPVAMCGAVKGAGRPKVSQAQVAAKVAGAAKGAGPPNFALNSASATKLDMDFEIRNLFNEY